MIEVERVSRYYGDTAAVEDLSFSAAKGRIHGFLGPNGAGKTTTMKMIAGLLPPHSGRIRVDGLDTVEYPLEIKKKIGILLEHPPLFMDMETGEFLRYAARLRGASAKEAAALADEAMEKMGLTEVSRRLLGNLSKGYKQKVGVAQAIVHRPPVLILDEPTSGLDPKAVIEMRSLIKELKDDHTILFSSHQLKEAEQVCDDVTIIARGRLMASAPKEEIGRTLAQRSIVNALVSRVSQEALEKIKELEFVSDVFEKKDGDLVRLQIFSQSFEDRREELSELIVNEHMGLLEMARETPDLETIFLEVTNLEAANVGNGEEA